MNEDLKTGIAIALCSRGRRFVKREPVAYLYGHIAKEGETPTHTINGVDYVGAVLPKLPETELPYAVLGRYALGGGSYRQMLCYTTLPLYEGFLILSNPEGCIGLSYMYREEGWQLAENWEDGSPFTLPSNNPIWANYDVMNSAGTAVSVEASEPVPVYE